MRLPSWHDPWTIYPKRLTLVPPGRPRGRLEVLARDRNLSASRNDAISKILCVTCSPIVVGVRSLLDSQRWR